MRHITTYLRDMITIAGDLRHGERALLTIAAITGITTGYLLAPLIGIHAVYA